MHFPAHPAEGFTVMKIISGIIGRGLPVFLPVPGRFGEVDLGSIDSSLEKMGTAARIENGIPLDESCLLDNIRDSDLIFPGMKRRIYKSESSSKAGETAARFRGFGSRTGTRNMGREKERGPGRDRNDPVRDTMRHP